MRSTPTPPPSAQVTRFVNFDFTVVEVVFGLKGMEGSNGTAVASVFMWYTGRVTETSEASAVNRTNANSCFGRRSKLAISRFFDAFVYWNAGVYEYSHRFACNAFSL